MNARAQLSGKLKLSNGAVVAVIGGGPAGTFFSMELLRRAKAAGLQLEVLIFERKKTIRIPTQPGREQWEGCNYCAGGVSPKLYDVLEELGLHLPPEVVQSRLESITIQGFWKNIELEVPPHRRMFSVFRGSRPSGIARRVHSFDSFLLESALAAGAKLVCAEVRDVRHGSNGKPILRYDSEQSPKTLEADLCVFACGINEHGAPGEARDPMVASARAVMPGFEPPRTRQTLIFELRVKPDIPPGLRNGAFFVEYGSKSLPLEMCSVIPKRDCITVVLIGKAVDAARTPAEVRHVIQEFLRLPHIGRLLSPASSLETMCLCGPRMVVGLASFPYGQRVSAVGDFVTSRLYKDGILSAQRTAGALAEAVLENGIDALSIEAGYAPILRHFQRNNSCASLVFFVHRLFFSSSVLSRVLYQSVITERKTTLAPRRELERILWRIASGDDEYDAILRCMLRPRTLWAVLMGGAFVTARNYFTEILFGLKWEGIGRFTTGVSIERLQEKRTEFHERAAEAGIAIPERPEFERMYTIKIAASRESILAQLETFGEADRQYLHPRWVRISRVAGLPHETGCVIRYEVFRPRFRFELRLEHLYGGHLALYRVINGFGKGGVLLFEIDEDKNGICLLSIYVSFDFLHGSTLPWKIFWGMFKLLFPHFVHDVLWNHSLCELKEVVERQSRPVTSYLLNRKLVTS